MPGRVDLKFPERSRLLLSGSGEDTGAEFLAADEVRHFRLGAGLAVLSGTAFAETGRSRLDSQIGLIADLHEAGVARIVAAYWPAGDQQTAAFMTEFYQALERDQDVAEALFSVRRKRIESAINTNFGSWAGFQLFIR